LSVASGPARREIRERREIDAGGLVHGGDERLGGPIVAELSPDLPTTMLDVSAA
jgi:hypothetical protein